MQLQIRKYLFIIDDAVLLVIGFDTGKLHHEVHEVGATFLALQMYAKVTFRNSRSEC